MTAGYVTGIIVCGYEINILFGAAVEENTVSAIEESDVLGVRRWFDMVLVVDSSEVEQFVLDDLEIEDSVDDVTDIFQK